MRILFFMCFLVAVAIGHAQQNKPYCSKYKTVTNTNRLGIDDHRSDSIDILHTFLELDMTAVSSQQISGAATLSLKSKVASNNSVRFDFEGLTVDSVIGPHVAAFSASASELLIDFQTPLSGGMETDVTVYYHGSPIKDASGWGGFYFSGSYSWNLGVGFAGDPHSYGRIWHPCFDNFIERSTYEFHVRVNNNRRAACNGMSQGVVDNGDGTSTYKWELAESIPSYLACVAVGPYTIVEGNIAGLNGNIPYQIHARSSDSINVVNSFTHLDEAVQAFEMAYGKYRFGKVGYTLVPFNSGAMEHATNIAYPISASNGSLAQEDLMAHELAHMWWGDNITCQTDGDMWINEGWASFSEYLFQESVYGRKAYEEAMKVDLRYMLQFGHHNEEEYRAVSGQPHEYVYGDHVYKKGALVAHNLRAYMGDAAFFSTIQQFMETFKYSPVSSDSLEKYFTQYSGQNLSSFFRDWVFRPGYNVVVLDSFKVNGTLVDLHLQQKLKGALALHDDVPVYYSIYDANWNSESGKTVMSGQYATQTVSTSLTPAYVVLYDRNEMAQARTVDRLVINDDGLLNAENMFWENIEVSSVSDSALVYFEHIWSAPDPIKDFYNQPYRLSDYHYWRVTGLDVENASMNVEFFYDGRETGPAYLDIDLISEQEDSLVLLYRSDAADDWREYEHYQKNFLGASDDGFGLIEMSQVKAGEYTLANLDHSVLGLDDVIEEGPWLSVSPNPSNTELLIQLKNSFTDDIKPLEIVDIQGKVVLMDELAGNELRVSTRELASGTYVCRLHTSSGVITHKFVVKH